MPSSITELKSQIWAKKIPCRTHGIVKALSWAARAVTSMWQWAWALKSHDNQQYQILKRDCEPASCDSAPAETLHLTLQTIWPKVPTNDKSVWINQDWQHQACSHVRAGSGWGQDINREQVAHGSSQQISDNYQNYCTSFLLSKTKRVDKIRVEIISNTWRWRTYMFMVKADSGKGHSLWKTTRQVKAIWSKQESTQNLTNFPNF